MLFIKLNSISYVEAAIQFCYREGYLLELNVKCFSSSRFTCCNSNSEAAWLLQQGRFTCCPA
jgi:hypothetical protein